MSAALLSLAASSYVDPEWLEPERAQIFARHWQLVGHRQDWAGAASTRTVEVGGIPILVTRTADDQWHAVHAVCRHRAGPVHPCAQRADRLRCAYHGWTYGLDGVLLSTPDMPLDPASRADLGLPYATVEVALDLVWVCLNPAPEWPLHTWLDGIQARLGVGRLAPLRHAQRSVDRIACNWKVYVDNYLEGYHLPQVHPGLNRLLDYRQYRTELVAHASLQCSPLGDGGPYAAGEAQYWFIHPNTMLNVLPGRLQTNRVLPRGVDQCEVVFEFYYDATLDPAEVQRLAAEDLAFSAEVQQEDMAICEAVQRNLACGSYGAGPLNPRRESAVAQFHALWRADLARAGFARD